jgi:hypothetical protein
MARRTAASPSSWRPTPHQRVGQDPGHLGGQVRVAGAGQHLPGVFLDLLVPGEQERHGGQARLHLLPPRVVGGCVLEHPLQ